MSFIYIYSIFNIYNNNLNEELSKKIIKHYNISKNIVDFYNISILNTYIINNYINNINNLINNLYIIIYYKYEKLLFSISILLLIIVYLNYKKLLKKQKYLWWSRFYRI